MSAEPKVFPVMYERNAKPGPTTIPWAMADRAYSVYSRSFGTSQSLERMAERGGFGAGELDDFIPGWREELSEFRSLEARHARVREALEEAEPLVGDLLTMVRSFDESNLTRRLSVGRALDRLRAALEDR